MTLTPSRCPTPCIPCNLVLLANDGKHCRESSREKPVHGLLPGRPENGLSLGAPPSNLAPGNQSGKPSIGPPNPVLSGDNLVSPDLDRSILHVVSRQTTMSGTFSGTAPTRNRTELSPRTIAVGAMVWYNDHMNTESTISPVWIHRQAQTVRPTATTPIRATVPAFGPAALDKGVPR